MPATALALMGLSWLIVVYAPGTPPSGVSPLMVFLLFMGVWASGMKP